MRNRTPRLILATAMLVGGLVAAPSLPAATTAAAPPGAARVSLIGDSTMAAMRWYGYDNDDADTIANNDIREIIGNEYDLVYSAESCRRLVSVSCRGREGYAPTSTLPAMKGFLKGQLGQVLVIMAGYDDGSIASGIDQIMAEAEAQGVSKVLWLTYRTTTHYTLPGGASAANLYQQHNAALRAALVEHPMLQLLDWNTYTANKPSWFASDGIHMTGPGAVGLAHYILDAVKALPPIARCIGANATLGSPTTLGAPTPFETGDSGFVGITPARVFDSRNGPKLGTKRSVVVPVGSAIPGDATSVVATITAADPCTAGYLAAYDCGTLGETSTLNFEAGRDTAAVAISVVNGGNICVYSSAPVDVIVDVVGYFRPGGDLFHAVGPTRWVDTRGISAAVQSGITGARAPGSQVEVQIAGLGGVPSNAEAVWLNVAATEAQTATTLTVYPGPCGTAPLSSIVNAIAGRTVAAATLVQLGSNGSVCVKNFSGSSQLIVDVAGWFGPGAGGLAYHGTTPSRLFDTRPTPLAANATRTVVLPGVSVINVGSIEATNWGFVAMKPCGLADTSSLLNMALDETLANVGVVASGTGNGVCISTSSASNVYADRVGTFVTPGP